MQLLVVAYTSAGLCVYNMTQRRKAKQAMHGADRMVICTLDFGFDRKVDCDLMIDDFEEILGVAYLSAGSCPYDMTQRREVWNTMDGANGMVICILNSGLDEYISCDFRTGDLGQAGGIIPFSWFLCNMTQRPKAKQAVDGADRNGDLYP